MEIEVFFHLFRSKLKRNELWKGEEFNHENGEIAASATNVKLNHWIYGLGFDFFPHALYQKRYSAYR